jgi:hypothetical protein
MPIILEQYSEKAIVLFGDTEKVKDRIKTLGGKYNSNLKGRPGWVFTNSSRPRLEAFLKTLEDEGDTQEIRVEPTRVYSSEGPNIDVLLKRIEQLELRIQKLEGGANPKPGLEPIIEFEEPEEERPKRLLKRK